MTLFFYTSALCPRCHIARKILQDIAAENPQLQIETIDILSAPQKAFQDKIRMIPAISTGKNQLFMLWPTKKAITNFLASNGCINRNEGEEL